MTVRFIASYEDRAKINAAAVSEGWKEGDSYLDYVEAEEFQTVKAFPTKDAAVAWVQAAIAADKTFFGLGDVDEVVDVPRSERCDACTCRGSKTVKTYVVGDKCIENEESIDDCYREEPS